MDYPRSSSSSSKGWDQVPIYQGEKVFQHHHEEREWLSSPYSPAAKIAGEVLEEEDDQDIRGKQVEEEEEEQGEEGDKLGEVVVEREHMFDKVVTPSDVGKLNRLVIPKQHAERYFPLDSTSNEKGLLLNFEDRMGKPWRFRYSYWNSSQSYVMTKGWSRFVKEKRLDAGDIVSFQRGVGEQGKAKLFIDWRRRPDHHHATLLLPPPPPPASYHHHHHQYPLYPGGGGGGGGGGGSPFSLHHSLPSTFVLRSHPHHPHPHPHRGAWDHHHHASSSSSSHLGPPMMNVVHQSHPYPYPYPHTLLRSRSGTDTGHNHHYACGFGNVVNPYPSPVSSISTTPTTGSLIFLRSSSASALGVGTNNSNNPHSFIPINSSSSSSSSLSRGGGGGGGGDQGLRQGVQGEEGGDEPMVYESVPVVQGKAAAKRLRLFGVNMECPITHHSHDFDILSSASAASSTPDHHHQHHQHQHHS